MEITFCPLSGRSKTCPEMPSKLYSDTHFFFFSDRVFPHYGLSSASNSDGEGTCKIFVALCLGTIVSHVLVIPQEDAV